MSIHFTRGDEPAVDMLAEVLQLYRFTAEELVMALNAIKAGDLVEAKAAATAVRDLKSAYFLVMEERGKVEKLSKQAAGAVGTGSLDLSAARDEIGRRLALLRDVGTG
jgi:hypothetical protein